MKKKTVYLAFCGKCGSPKKLTPMVLEFYFKQHRLQTVYCDNCSKENKLPDYILKIIDLL